MLLTPNDSSDLIVEFARQASQTKDKSLFSLLLLLEEQICEDACGNKMGKSEVSTVLDPRPSLFSTSSRYIE
jgi:hypothetical protein